MNAIGRLDSLSRRRRRLWGLCHVHTRWLRFGGESALAPPLASLLPRSRTPVQPPPAAARQRSRLAFAPDPGARATPHERARRRRGRQWTLIRDDAWCGRTASFADGWLTSARKRSAASRRRISRREVAGGRQKCWRWAARRKLGRIDAWQSPERPALLTRNLRAVDPVLSEKSKAGAIF
jgi:hypothetical protein